jgi:hypothetical protein
MSNDLSSKGKKAERKISTEKHRKKDICEDDFYLQRIVTFFTLCSFCNNSADMKVKLVVITT